MQGTSKRITTLRPPLLSPKGRRADRGLRRACDSRDEPLATTGPPPRPGGNSGRCACPEQARRAPPDASHVHSYAGRQGRRPAVPRGHRRALPQHRTWPRPTEQQTVDRDGSRTETGARAPPTAHSRQFRGCSWVSGLLAPVRLLRLSALLPHPARWRRTVARLSGAAPALRRTSGIRLPLSFSRPLRRPAARSLTPARSYGASWRSAALTKTQQSRWLRSLVATLLRPVRSGSHRPAEYITPGPCLRSSTSITREVQTLGLRGKRARRARPDPPVQDRQGRPRAIGR